MPAEMLRLLEPEAVTAGLLYLVSEQAPSRAVLAAGAGCFGRAILYETSGIYLAPEERTPEAVAARWDEISDPARQEELTGGFRQTERFLRRAAAAMGIEV